MGRNLRMQEDSSGRSTVFPWGEPPASEPISHAAGDAIANTGNPPSFGTVVAVDEAGGTISVEWDDGEGRYGAIVYPANATFLRRLWPWEL